MLLGVPLVRTILPIILSILVFHPINLVHILNDELKVCMNWFGMQDRESKIFPKVGARLDVENR